MAKHLEVGRQGEVLAEIYLKQKGYKILDRNVSNPHGKRLGEIDIVAQFQGEVVFIEVKTLVVRREGEDFLPEWQVTRSKLEKLERIASYYLRHSLEMDTAYHFDVVAVRLYESGEEEIRHIEHVFL